MGTIAHALLYAGQVAILYHFICFILIWTEHDVIRLKRLRAVNDQSLGI